jgi:polysaccharide deacetylase family protein (PEP-CTERM system associated)
LAQSPIHALTIDFEDWYQGIEIPYAEWDKFEDRIEAVGDKLLTILAEANTKATFFMLGYVAEKHPEILKRIEAEGHEIGTHGFSHTLIYTQQPEVFKQELTRAIRFLEDMTGNKVLGHRAPFFSITKDSLWALDILGELGVRYDSSIFPVLNYRYGIPDAPRFPYTIKREKCEFVEFPSRRSSCRVSQCQTSGGAFQNFPIIEQNRRSSVNREGQPVRFTTPVGIDPDHPLRCPRRIALTHYFNLCDRATAEKALA